MTTYAVAVDFDGVIHDYDGNWDSGAIHGAPIPGAFEALKYLMEKYAVFVHTTRQPVTAARWIKEHSGIETSWHEDESTLPEFWDQRDSILVTRVKLPALAYIDDRAIRFENWGQALGDFAEGGK